MMKSLYSGVAGLKVHNQRMDVVGNNISNVNTTAYKASAVTFKDIFYQNKSNASVGTAVAGGTNANQIGYGAALGAIKQNMTQSGLTYSDSYTECAIQGEGFFQVMDENGNTFYTRSGVFDVDNYGNLVDPNGNIVLGVSGDPTGVGASSQRINLYVPSVENNTANVTKSVDGYEVTISAADYGEDGNITLTITNSDVPFAVQNGSTLAIQMDLDREYADATAFQNAVNAAITAGGVTFPDGVLPLEFNFLGMPATQADRAARAASNTLSYRSDGATADDVYLTFTASQAGESANAYEINLRTSATSTITTARWESNVLLVTIPSTGASANEIQTAITNASNGEVSRQFTVTGNAINITQAANIGDLNLRVGMTGGADNFFKNIAESLGTVKLTGGRIAAEQTTQDLKQIFIDDKGVIYGVHEVHGTIAMGRIDIVTFENPTGLEQVGTSYWTESLSSGDPTVKIAGDDGSGSIVSGALEMSNVDLSQEFSDMIITQRGFQANSRVITVSDTMLEELVNLKR